MKQFLVSIIIPTYNRAYLIGETLDSILSQTYAEWECIIVDDGSTDNTDEILSEYVNKNNRFIYFKRPENKPKGANACRNIGLEKAKGDYVVFFDSDDLMTPNHLELKMTKIAQSEYDYVITRTKFFNKENIQIDDYYQFDKYEITPHNYVTQKINWLTYDICLKAGLAKSIQFNENLQSGQEYNYFCKLVYKSVNAVFIDEVVTLRRHHNNSIRSRLKSEYQIKESLFKANLYTYMDIAEMASAETRLYLIEKVGRFIMDRRTFFGHSPAKIFQYLRKETGFKCIYVYLYLISMKFTGKGNYFREQFKR